MRWEQFFKIEEVVIDVQPIGSNTDMYKLIKKYRVVDIYDSGVHRVTWGSRKSAVASAERAYKRLQDRLEKKF